MSVMQDILKSAPSQALVLSGWSHAEGVPTRREGLVTTSPIDGSALAWVNLATTEECNAAAALSSQAFASWQQVPAPLRGHLVRAIGEAVRARKSELAAIITLEVGKTVSEAEGEVQEWIDVCEFAVGLSRQLHGLTIVSERPQHRMMEQWLPLGSIAIITAFNFPMAVWAWNAMLALVCGDAVVWKPSEKAALCAAAVMEIVSEVLDREGAPRGLCQLLQGTATVGEALATSPIYRLVSATGSTAMGRKVAALVGVRLGRTLLELGGNNAMIVAPSARQELALRAALFAAVGTAGQRCTTLRRLIVHRSLAKTFTAKLVKAYGTLTIGDPRLPHTLVGPLIDAKACNAMESALVTAVEQGGKILCGGGRRYDVALAAGFYVTPAVVAISPDAAVVQQETFAPILYLHTYETFEEALKIQNSVSQGLSSALFTEQMREAEQFVSATGSDCGISNVNIGTSGAEIGGAFGGEKESGGGRESGSDAWKSYMRRATSTLNYGEALPLAQGVKFEWE